MAPLVSPRSGRREAGRRTRVALGTDDADAKGGLDEAIPLQVMVQQGQRTRVRIQGSILSRSTASTHAEEPVHRSSPSTSIDSASDNEDASGDEEPPPLVISEEIRRRILDEEDAKRSRKVGALSPFSLICRLI